MEVSSIGLDQGRVNGVAFDVAVLTNLTRDHLEYHGTMEAYAEAKARLFAMSGLHSAVLNLDDPFGRLLADRLSGSGVRRVGYRIGPDNEHPSRVEASFVARDVAIEPAGLRFRLTSPEGQADVEAALVGRFNVSNLLAVLATLGEAGIPLDAAADLVRGLSPPPGRMQRLGGDDRPLAVIDYAHSPDALDQTLAALREVACARSGELICVFGCGGERDPGKRIEMGQVAAKRADRVVVTSDNPRREDPFVIIEQIRAGAPQARSIPDRAAAIGAAIGAANAADVVLIAGKGHERYQEVGGERRPFSDARQAARELDAWRKGRR
jgi:UDP-N-acetylmuramoyl-L-alanyl-D-glutamate--2,6-diaminopimelate ligase